MFEKLTDLLGFLAIEGSENNINELHRWWGRRAQFETGLSVW